MGMLVLALILITTGSYVRRRTLDQSEAVDWLVMVEVGLSIVGGCLGVLLARREPLAGFGAKMLAGYLLAVFASGLFSPYRFLVFGYWLLLAGTAVLCLGLIASSTTEDSLRRIENLIFITLSFMLLKDAILDAFFIGPQVIERMDEYGIEMYRFGMGTTTSNSMGMAGAVAFWMSFNTAPEQTRISFWRILWRGLFAAIVLLTRTRIALAALIIGAIVRWWFVHWHSRGNRSYVLLVAVPCVVATVCVFTLMSWLWKAPVITDVIGLVNRGENSAKIMTVTGRTDVWPYAIQRVFDGPVSFLLGHGYGVSKFVLNQRNAAFFAFHAHNTFLEALLSTGLLGALPFVVLVGYSLNWLARFSHVSQVFSLGFALRAISVVSAILISTMTESDLVTKIGPVVIVYMFYVLSLDRKDAFLRAGQLQRT